MRTQSQIDNIKSRIIDPYSIDDFLSNEEVEYLVTIFESHSDNDIDPQQKKVYKNTGPITLDLRSYIEDPIISKILNKIQSVIGAYEITAAFFFYTNYPHIIHNDDLKQLPDGIYKGITLPLKFYRKTESLEIPNLCFFDQFYFHGPSKFFKGSEDSGIQTYYNKQIYDYADVDGLTADNTISEETYQKLFTHLKPQWLEGLSLHSYFPWKIGSALIFDSTRLHAASDFRPLGIEYKLGISIFTSIPAEIKEGAAIEYYKVSST
jgi:hypothetical protein